MVGFRLLINRVYPLTRHLTHNIEEWHAIPRPTTRTPSDLVFHCFPRCFSNPYSTIQRIN